MADKSKTKRETTSIRIDPELWKEAKILAVKQDLSIGQFIEKLIKKELN